MSDAFNEVQDELRHERLMTLWRQYGNYLIGLIVLVIVLTACISTYQYFDHKKKIADTDAIYAVIDNPDFYKDLNADDLQVRTSMKALVLMQGAGAAMDADDADKAADLYEQVRNLAPAQAYPYHGLATLMLARLDVARSEELYTEIITNKKSIWRSYALLELAAHKGQNADYAVAIDLLDQINALGYVPASVRDQATALRHVFEIQS